MTDDERFDRLALAIERVADSQIATNGRVDQLTQAHLDLVSQVGLAVTEIQRLSQQQVEIRQETRDLQRQQNAMQQQQTAMLQRQAEQDQRFDILLGEIRHIVQRLEGGSR